MVKVNYVGKLLDGTVFDTSDPEIAKKAGVYDQRRPYEPIEFPLGVGQVIPGWEEAISMMQAGTKATLVIPSNLAYGEQGAGGFIPPFSTLTFDVELVSFGPPKPEVMQQIMQQQMQENAQKQAAASQGGKAEQPKMEQPKSKK
jgi:FKBP-type peptidyl-prolyl cis-trans isomerase 2